RSTTAGTPSPRRSSAKQNTLVIGLLCTGRGLGAVCSGGWRPGPLAVAAGTGHLLGGEPAVDDECGAVLVARAVGGEVDDGFRDLLRAAEAADELAFGHVAVRGGRVGLRAGHPADPRGVHRPGSHCVGADSARPVVHGYRTGQ